MTKQTEAMKLALEALEYIEHNYMSLPAPAEKAITALREALAEQPAQQEPVALKWQQSPIRTAWGDDMVVASVAIDKDHTLSLYCERDQVPKVDAMFAQRTWVGLSDEEKSDIWCVVTNRDFVTEETHVYADAIEAKLKEQHMKIAWTFIAVMLALMTVRSCV